MKKLTNLAFLFTIAMMFACGPAEMGTAEADGSDAECQSDKDCDSDEVCNADNMCVPDTTDECASDDDCVGDKVCEDGLCQEDDGTSSECASDDDCDNGRVCEDQTCVDDSEEEECASDDDCGAGEVCDDDNMCVEDDPECTSNDDCGDGKVCEDQTCVNDSEEESRQLMVEVSTANELYAIVCSYERCSNTADPASCDNGFWQQGAVAAEQTDSVEFGLELQKNRPAVQSVRLNCDMVEDYGSSCYDERPPEETGACADQWLAHGPYTPELRGELTVTLDGETYSVDNSTIAHLEAGEDASGDPVSIFPFNGGSGVGISIPALESELGL